MSEDIGYTDCKFTEVRRMSRVLARPFGEVVIPDGLTDLDAFRAWVHSGDLPEKLKVHFINGEAWVDFMEEVFSHNAMKTALGRTLSVLIWNEKIGRYWSDGVFLTNDEAELATTPDAMFVSTRSFEDERVWFTAGNRPGAVATEMVGSPDVVIEIVSPSSVEKDVDRLMLAYYQAGIDEYWVIDVRDETEPVLAIFRRGTRAFAAVRKVKGWVKSDVFGKAFRLAVTETAGLIDFELEVK